MLVTEKEQIARAGCAHCSALHRLLVGVTIEAHPVQTVHELCESGRVDPVRGGPAPEIRNAEKTLGRSQEIGRHREARRQLRDVGRVAEGHPAVIADAKPLALPLLDRERRGDRQPVDDRRRVGRRGAHVRDHDADDAALRRPDLIEVICLHPTEVVVRALRVEPIVVACEERQALAEVGLIDAL